MGSSLAIQPAMTDTLANLPPLKDVIRMHELQAKKSLGQHFLLDGRITDDIARYAGDLSACHVIEVGPGPGGLTRSLLRGGALHVHVIEKDVRCLALLEELRQAAPGRLSVHNDDALKFDYSAIPSPRKIVANLPYNVGTLMLLNWLDMIYRDPGSFTSLTLMFQKEVTERIIAAHGNKDYGRLSVLCQWLCDVRTDMTLPPGAFVPPPAVSSAVVTLTPRATPLVDVKKETLEKVMAAAFGQRRKMLRKALKPTSNDVEALLASAGIDPTWRAEQVDVRTLCALARAYQEQAAGL
ncbi:MAG: 16S rRNA (adenine(1518)-N(6)/adenine(1519)-N(6))-dimethyltransferase RsmA [Alphaproteobacteria bacterium]